MRLPAFLAPLLLTSLPLAAAAQASITPRGGDLGLTYQWVRTNTQPGNCGCFGLNGVGVSASLALSPRWRAAAEVNGSHQASGPATGNSLTLVSYLAGARYQLRPLGNPERRTLHPFAQLLVGSAHAGGGVAGAGDGTYTFASRIGGGLDLPAAPHLSLRLAEVDYYLTRFANTKNSQQNNLLVAGGLVLRWN